MIGHKSNILIFAHSIEPNGVSGSESILVELFKRMGHFFGTIQLYTWRPGEEIYRKMGLTGVNYKISKVPLLSSFHVSFLFRVLYGVHLGLTCHVDHPEITYLYPASDFWPDSLPAILLKLRYPQVRLIATYFLTAPNPFFGFVEGRNSIKLPSINGIFYWLMQKPISILFRHLAFAVLITSEPDRAKFPNQKVFVVKGGVDIKHIEEYKRNSSSVDKVWDCVFMGRFHPQKGVLELLDVWSLVIKKMPGLRLVMIGDGPLFGQVKNRISALAITASVHLTGTLIDINEKYRLFSQSKIALHPALYDSGGMAVAEIMAFDIPGVAFDLEAYKTYYPKGFVKVPIGRNDLFAQAIIDLIQNQNTYTRLAHEAHEMIYKTWSWDLRAAEFVIFLKN